MEMVRVLVLAAASTALLYTTAQITGRDSVAALSPFECILGVTISAILANMLTADSTSWWRGAAAIAVCTIAGVINAVTAKKKLRRREPIRIMINGRIIDGALTKAGISIEQLLAQARLNGYFSLSDIDYAIMENGGSISFLPKPMARALNPGDFNFAPIRTGINTNLIVNGKIIEQGLAHAGITMEYLEQILTDRQQKINNILLLTINEAGQIEIFTK